MRGTVLSDEEYLSDAEAAPDARSARLVDDPETWMELWTEELLTLWYGLEEHARAMGAAVLDRCDFPRFAQFCWDHSSRVRPVDADD